MTKINAVECDDCGAMQTENDIPNPNVLIYKCGICDKDYCSYCAEEHAKDETGLRWEESK